MQIYLVISLIFALFVAAFAVQNTMPVAISLLFWRFEEISLVLVILGSAAFGALCVFLLGMVKQVSQSFKIKERDAANQRLTGEIEELREQLESFKSQQENSFIPNHVGEVEEEVK